MGVVLISLLMITMGQQNSQSSCQLQILSFPNPVPPIGRVRVSVDFTCDIGFHNLVIVDVLSGDESKRFGRGSERVDRSNGSVSLEFEIKEKLASRYVRLKAWMIDGDSFDSGAWERPLAFHTVEASASEGIGESDSLSIRGEHQAQRPPEGVVVLAALSVSAIALATILLLWAIRLRESLEEKEIRESFLDERELGKMPSLYSNPSAFAV
jgi:hypothetical protein